MTDRHRRVLLLRLGAGAAAPLVAPAQAQPPRSADYRFFTTEDVAFVRPAIDRLLPADEFPSASEAGVVTYIDRQLEGPFGRGERMYLAAPFQAGTPQQGYQLGLTPAAVYRESLDALASHPLGRAFATRPANEQDDFLRELEAGAWNLGRVPSAVFFETLLANTIEGYFADPVYGGNRAMAGWRMLGFPGAYAQFAQWVGRHNLRFDRPPMSIAMGAAAGHDHDHPRTGTAEPPAAGPQRACAKPER